MPTTPGIGLGNYQPPPGVFTPAQLAAAFQPGTAAAAAAAATPQAATAAAARAAQTGFAVAATTQLYPGNTRVGAAAPDANGNVLAMPWLDRRTGPDAGIDPQAAMRGHPPAYAWWQQKPAWNRRLPTTPQPVPTWLQSRPYDRGAQAYAPHFGLLPTNPIGAGVYAPYRLPTIAGPGARYVFGAIWFDVQTIPTSIQINPTIPVETINALIATSRVGGTYLTSG